MVTDPSKDVIIRFSIPVKLSALLIAIAAIAVYIPLALQAIPAEALAAAAFYLAVPGFFAYLAIIIFTYRLQVGPDRFVTEAFPNPLVRSRQCLFAEISGIEKDKWWSSLSVFRYRIPDSFRITNLETRDSGPLEFLEAVRARVGRDIFLERATKSLRRYWKWHALLINSILLLGSAGLSIQILQIGGIPDLPDYALETLLGFLAAAILLLLILDAFIYRLLNRDD